MEIGGNHGGTLGRVTLCEIGQQYACEYIAAACSGHSWVARRIEVAFAVGEDNSRPGSLEYDVNLHSGSHAASALQAFETVGGMTGQAVHFSWMGCQYAVRWNEGEPVGMFGQYVECVSIEYEWFLGTGKLQVQGTRGLFTLSQTGAYGDSCETFGIDGQGKAVFVLINMSHCFWYCSLDNRAVGFGDVYGEQSDTTAQTGACRENRCSCHTDASGYEECMSVSAFVGELISGFQEGTDIFKGGDVVWTVGFLNALLAQTDVETEPFAQIALVLSEEKGQFGKLQGEGCVSAYDIVGDIVTVVLADRTAGRWKQLLQVMN